VSAETLVVGPSWVGDMVMAQSLYRLLKAREPGIGIDVLAPGWSLPLLERMPEVRHGIELPVAHGELALGKRRGIGLALRGRYDRAIVLPRSLKSALVPWFARIPRRTGFRGEFRYALVNDMRPFDRERLDQTVRRFAALGLEPDEAALPELPEPRLTVDAAATAATVERLGLSADGPVVALMPGAEYGPAKQWPAPYFAELAQTLAARGVSVWILGSVKEAALGAGIERAAGTGAVRTLCGETSLLEAVDLLGRADVAVSNDSGLMHIAAAVGTHVVALYGSSTPDFTPPLTANATVHYRRLSCSPCFRRECPLGHLDCLRGIAAAEVVASVEGALDGARTRSAP
jgi:heptosyltransferase-2